MYEAKLKELNPGLSHIQYDISDLNAYLDTFTDITVMVIGPFKKTYGCRTRSV